MGHSPDFLGIDRTRLDIADRDLSDHPGREPTFAETTGAFVKRIHGSGPLKGNPDHHSFTETS